MGLGKVVGLTGSLIGAVLTNTNGRVVNKYTIEISFTQLEELVLSETQFTT